MKNRDIKFRGMRADGKGMVYGYYLEIEYCDGKGRKPYIKVDGCSPIEIGPDTLGQYTGLSDKHGTEVYTGDIVEVYLYDIISMKQVLSDKASIGVISLNKYNHSCIMINNIECHIDNLQRAEVIGNIHQNKELR